jgi:hypothetical protein
MDRRTVFLHPCGLHMHLHHTWPSDTSYSNLQARIQEFQVGDDMDEEKTGRDLGAAVGPQRGPGAEPLVGVKGDEPL